jgi:hypothetical protein
MTFDPKCLDLAQNFLSDVPELDAAKLAPVLAQHIQDTIEEFIASERLCETDIDASFFVAWGRPEKAGAPR